MTAETKSNLLDLLKPAILAGIEEAIEDEVEDCMKKIERKVRERTGAIAIQVAEYLSVEQLGSEIIIRVDTKDLKL